MDDQLVVYVDVDDTLIHTDMGLRTALPMTVELVKKLHTQGALLYCWSAGGADYAREVATDLGLDGLFEAFLPKPEVLIDDLPLEKWWLVEQHPLEISSDIDQKTFLEKLKRH